MTDDRVVYRTCPLCEATCGLEVTVRDGEVARIRGDRDDVFSHGFICPKGSTLKQFHEDPDRLRRPQLRNGDKWRDAEWDEAFAAIDDGLGPILDEHGRDSVAVYLGNPNVHNLAGSLYLRPLIKALGSKNVYSAATTDQMPKHVSSGLMFGNPNAIPVPDLDRTDYLLMLGANPWASNGSLCTAPDFPGRLKAIQDRGGRFVVVDPRRTRTAKEADEHLFIRPGTDAHLLLGIIHTLYADGLVDLGTIADHVVGVDEIGRAAQPFSPDRVAAATRIPADTIRRLAHELSEAESAAVYGRIGTHTVEFGTVASWAVDALNLLTGNLDRPGGAMFSLPAHGPRPADTPGGRGFVTGRWHSRVKNLPEVRGEFPAATLADEIETEGDGQVRAVITIGGNPVLSNPNSLRLDAALAQLDFMVSVDPYRNETTRRADVILPPPSPLERSHYDLAFYGISVRNVANYSPPVFTESDVPPESETLARLALVLAGEGPEADPSTIDELLIGAVLQRAQAASTSVIADRDPAELLAALGDRPGPERVVDLMLRAGPFGDGFGVDPEGLSLDQLAGHPHGIDLGALEPQVPGIINTPSAKIELAPEPVVTDLGRLEADLDSDPNGEFLLVGRRHVRSNNSWMHNIRVLVKGKGRCTLQVHPGHADRIGLVDGEPAQIASRVGEVEASVEVTPEIMTGVVSLPHGWGHDLEGIDLAVARERPGVNSNVLTDEEAIDPLSGNAVLNAIPVTVEPVPSD